MNHLSDEIIVKYLDGDAGKSEKEFISRHTAECRECREMIEAYLDLNNALYNLGGSPAPENIKAKVMKRVEAIALRRKKQQRMFYALFGVLVASLIAVIVLMIAWYINTGGGGGDILPEITIPNIKDDMAGFFSSLEFDRYASLFMSFAVFVILVTGWLVYERVKNLRQIKSGSHS